MANSDRGRGRPLAKNPLNYQLYVRLTEADGRRLDELADRLNRDRADLIREIVLDGLKRLETKKT
jgi:predicted DNA-binding protein